MPDAPAPLRGLRISGKPDLGGERARRRAALCTAAEAAVGTPAARSASFIDGLSRHSQVVRTDVPGIVQASRTCAAAMVCASIVASSRSTHSLSWTQRTACGQRGHVGDRRHLLVVVQPALQLVVQRVRRPYSPMPITVAPASARARANCRWLAGKNGSTKTTFMPGMVTGYVLPMVVAGFVAPYLLDTTTRFVEAAAALPGVSWP